MTVTNGSKIKDSHICTTLSHMRITHQASHLFHIVEFCFICSQNSFEVRVLTEKCQHIIEYFAPSLMLVHINELSLFRNDFLVFKGHHRQTDIPQLPFSLREQHTVNVFSIYFRMGMTAYYEVIIREILAELLFCRIAAMVEQDIQITLITHPFIFGYRFFFI